MSTRDISEARDPDLRSSMAAMRRAAQLARTIAIQTDTSIAVFENGEILQISAAALRAAAEQGDSAA
ncbi:hypothetical protein [Aquimonas sp.]|uniref:hypothetical protein n=1 Tax=Aquimonas sp. TaxID=1872588 RepID=UPI0037BE2E4C